MNHYLWVFFEKFGNISVRLISIILLSRILAPEDFGLFGMVAVFIVVSSVLVDSGMGLALIKKREASDIDYSTVLIFNMATSAVMYALVYFLAPYIAGYYGAQEIEKIIKVLALVILIRPLAIIQITRMSKELIFKPQAIIFFGSSVLSLFVAYILAARGLGVWALVWQQIAEAIVTTCAFYSYARYFPRLVFSNNSFNELFGFGFLVMLSSMIRTFYLNVLSIIFGRQFGPGTVGFYAQAYKINDIYVNTVSAVIDKASFPILVKSAENEVLFMQKIKALLRMTAFICFVFTGIVAACAELIVTVLLGDSWTDTIWMLEIISLAGVGLIVEAVTRSIIKSRARASTMLKLELFKCAVTLITLVGATMYGVRVMLWAFVLVSIINAFISMLAAAKLIGYKITEQFIDIYIPLIMAVVVYVFLLVLNDNLPIVPIAKLIFSGFFGLLLYGCMGFLLRIKEAGQILNLVTNKLYR